MKKVLVMSVVLATLVWTMGLATFIPAVSAATLTAGDLIKGSGSAVYFYAADGKRYTFPTLSTYMTWYADFSTVKTITDSEMAAISLAGNVVVRPGTKLIKIDTVPKVFAVEPKGKLVWVASEAVANTLYGADWAKKIVTIPDGFWTNYTDSGLSLSGTTYPEGQLVKWAGSTNVYYVTGGKKALVSSDAVLAANMWKAGDVVTAPASIIMVDGTAITAAVATLVDVSQGGGAGSVVVPTGAGTLTVALAGDTPAASPVAVSGTANFVKFGLTANGAAMTVSKILITKGGYSGTGDVENIKITDLSGVGLTNSTSLNTNGTANLTFSPALSLAAGETRYFYVKSGIVAGVSSGVTVSFAIAASSDVTSSAATVAGNFPVLGNAMSVVAVTIGTAKVYTDGTVTDTTPDSGDNNVIINKFRVEAGTTEAITIESITLMEAGTAGLSDVKNLELWSVTQNKSLGEVAAYDSNGKVSFTNLNIVVGKGEIHRFSVREDIVSGAGLTTNTDLVDGTEVLMSVKGNAYGFYITATDPNTWGGKGASDQTINTGALSISKSTTTPATGKIAEAADQLLAVFDVEAKGEDVRVSAFKVTFTLGGTGDGADLISCKLTDKDGLLVAGPADGTDALDYVNFTDTFVVPVGINKYSLKCRVFDSDSNDFTGGATYQMVATAATGITAKGVSTNDSITASGTATANVMTVATVALTATTLGTPAAQSVAAGTANMIWSTFTLDAANSGENVNVTNVVLEDTVTVAGNAEDIDNVEVWCDQSSASSERGDIYEKKVSDTESWEGTGNGDDLLSVNFVETVTVTKNSFVKCAVVADLGSGAGAGEKHTISLDTDSGDVTATGADTGATATVTPTGAGQTMTVAANGTLTVSVDATSPKAAIFVSSEAKQTVAVFKLAANSVEALDLDELTLTDDGSDTGVATYYIYSSRRADGVAVTEPIASTPGQAAVTAVITDGTVSVPAGSYVLITVKADINYIDGTTIDNGATLEVTVADGSTDVLTTGLSSGAAVVGTATNYDAATHQLYEARPVVTKDSSSPSGTIGTGASTLVAVFKIDNASGTQDIVMSAANDDDMVFNLSGSATGVSCAGGCAVVFKDKNGNLLSDSQTAIDLGDGIAVTNLNLDFTDGTLTVPVGDYELVKVYANTTDFTTAGNSLQVWLDDAAAANFSWGIDSSAGGAQVMETADISWRGDIYGNTLGK